MIDVLYVHPPRHASDYNIPVGLLGLMNGIDCAKRGAMYFEVTEELISRSKILIMDCHWYFSLAEIGRLAERYKGMNPGIRIVVGGHTATVFAEQIVRSFMIDYVIKGDAEGPFPLLIQELLAGRDGRSVPNVVHKDFITPQSYRLTKKDFGRCDFLSINWFPFLEKRMREVHARPDAHYHEQLGVYPLIPIYKGCAFDCPFCYTRQKSHARLYGRGFMLRSSESVVRDLTSCSRHPHIKQVYMIADFVNVAGDDFAKRVFSKKYDLNLYYEFEHFNGPSLRMLDRIVGCFNACEFKFIFGEPFNQDLKARFAYLSDVMSHLAKMKPRVSVGIYGGGSRHSYAYIAELQRRHEGLRVGSYDQWFKPIPFVRDVPDGNRRAYFSRWKRKADADSSVFFVAQSARDDEYRFRLTLGSSMLDAGHYRQALRCFRRALRVLPRERALECESIQTLVRRCQEALRTCRRRRIRANPALSGVAADGVRRSVGSG